MSPAAKGGSNATGGAGGGQKLLTEQQRQRALTRAERRRLRRSTPKYRNLHASRERIRVEAFNQAFQQVRQLLPPEAGGDGGEQPQSSRKMSKIETLRAAIHYLRYLDFLLKQQQQQELAPTQQMNECANGQRHHNSSSNAVVLR